MFFKMLEKNCEPVKILIGDNDWLNLCGRERVAPSALSASQGDFWVCRIPTAKRLILSGSKKILNLNLLNRGEKLSWQFLGHQDCFDLKNEFVLRSRAKRLWRGIWGRRHLGSQERQEFWNKCWREWILLWQRVNCFF